jgi:hypothetical protein
MTIAASYLPSAAEGDRDPTHFVPELSRRARGFATCAMIRHLGREDIAAMVQEHCRLTVRFAERLRREPGAHVLNDVVLNQVIVRFGTPEADETADRLTRETILLRGRRTLARSLGDAAIGDLCPDHRGGPRPEPTQRPAGGGERSAGAQRRGGAFGDMGSGRQAGQFGQRGAQSRSFGQQRSFAGGGRGGGARGGGRGGRR